MKQEIDCGVIRDLLPLYEDGAASEESQELVRTHLKDCPACREELRKMRTPISLPPDEDEEAVKRYLARQAELRRKENRRLAMIGIPLAAVLVFCLCYALIPRNWESVAGDMEPDWVMGTHTVFVFRSDAPGMDIWTVNWDPQYGPAFTGKAMDALRAGSYRAELRNLVSFLPFKLTSGSGQNLESTIVLSLVKDNQIPVTILLREAPDDYKVEIHLSGIRYPFYYHVDKELYDTLAALIDKYGEFDPGD